MPNLNNFKLNPTNTIPPMDTPTKSLEPQLSITINANSLLSAVGIHKEFSLHN